MEGIWPLVIDLVPFYELSFCFYVMVTFFFFFNLWSQLWHMEVPRLGTQSEPQLPTYATATEMPDPSLVYDLHYSSEQRWILNPLSGTWDQT